MKPTERVEASIKMVQQERINGCCDESTAFSIATELERERELRIMQLAAISTASIENTDATHGNAGNCHDDYKSTALFDVIRAVKREMDWREQCDQLRAQLAEAVKALERIEKCKPHLHEVGSDGGCAYIAEQALAAIKARKGSNE